MGKSQEIRFCTTDDDVRIAYATVGSGPPFVKVANWLSHLEFDWDSPVWRHWLAELSRQHTLVRYDQRGCGLSDWDVSGFSVDAWVRDLEAVVEALGLERFPLLGIAQGGAVAIAFAARHPDQVSHLILVESYARGRYRRGLSPEEREVVDLYAELMRVGWGTDNPIFRQVFSSLFMPEATIEQMQWFNDLQKASASTENALKIRRAFNMLDVTGEAEQVSVPTLVLHARDDAAVPFEEGRLLASLIPEARFVPLEGRNHIMLADEPAWEHFVAELRSFVQPEDAVSDPAAFMHDLTKREREVLDLIAQGLTNEEIEGRLVISSSTVRNHITNIFSKLGVTHRAQAIVLAREAGMGTRHPEAP